MVWSQIEATPPHLTYLLLSAFLITYALFSHFIRNALHLSEPPLATLLGIIFGPSGFNVLDPTNWGFQDHVTQEVTRVIIGVQVFVIAVQLPKAYLARHWKSVAMMLGPVMTFSWLITALFIHLILRTSVTTALITSACLAPTDPVLAASVLAESRFSNRVPARLKNLLACESGCNDGVSFPFIYIGLFVAIQPTAALALRDWSLITILWQCIFGILLGTLIGFVSNRLLRISEARDYITSSSFLVFYFLLALFCVGVASTLGVDDFLVAFGAGTGFAWDGWFAKKTRRTNLPDVLDLLLNSSMFVYFGAIIPWSHFIPSKVTPEITPMRLVGLLILIILLRRIPFVLAMKPWTPDVRTYREALFCGHFGPMGLGALFLAIEARAQLDTKSAIPLQHSLQHPEHEFAIETIWLVVCFIVLGSILIHGLSVAAISVASHFSRPTGERVAFVGGEREPLRGMVHGDGGGDSEPSDSGEEDDMDGD